MGILPPLYRGGGGVEGGGGEKSWEGEGCNNLLQVNSPTQCPNVICKLEDIVLHPLSPFQSGIPSIQNHPTICIFINASGFRELSIFIKISRDLSVVSVHTWQ